MVNCVLIGVHLNSGAAESNVSRHWSAAAPKSKSGDFGLRIALFTEIWSIVNLTADSHPIHLHLVMFQVIDRIPYNSDNFYEAQRHYLEEGGELPDPLDFATGDPEPPSAWETGWKDTVNARPNYITRIIATFDLEGLYAWHCHIIEHEDNEMMRPFYVGKMP